MFEGITPRVVRDIQPTKFHPSGGGGRILMEKSVQPLKVAASLPLAKLSNVLGKVSFHQEVVLAHRVAGTRGVGTGILHFILFRGYLNS